MRGLTSNTFAGMTGVWRYVGVKGECGRQWEEGG